jgi:LPS export ABC transporter protein LptC
MKLKALMRGSLLSLLLLGFWGCQPNAEIQQQTDSSPSPTSEPETRLVLNNATLEQPDEKGQTAWKIQVDRAVYSPDRKKAEIENIKGNLFQDGKVVLQVSAKKGEIDQDGLTIYLKENVIATDSRNGVVIRSEEVEWKPKQDILTIRKNLRGSHPRLNARAKEARYYTRQERLELIGDAIATTKEPQLQLKAERLNWKVDREQITSDRPLTMVRFAGNTITDRLSANRGEVNIKRTNVTVKDNIEFRSVDPSIQVAANVLSWNYKTRLILSNQPVRLYDYKALVEIRGNQGQIDLSKEVAQLKGGVRGYSSRNQATIYASEMVWYIPAQRVEATGDVNYTQVNPKLNLTGDKAVGKLQENNVVVSGNNKDRVLTEIVPE